jgi:hypothetical protein
LFELNFDKVIETQAWPSSGQLEIAGLPMGDYDQCLQIKSPQVKDKSTIKGQYCSLALPLTILPSKGSYIVGEPIDDYIETLITNYLNSTFHTKASEDNQKYITSDGRFKLMPNRIEEVLLYYEYAAKLKGGITVGLCLPLNCRPKDMENAINKCEINFFILKENFKLKNLEIFISLK